MARFAVRKMRFFDTFHLLDVATGTADLAIEAARRHPEIRVTGIDFIAEMLAPGRKKVALRGLAGRIRLLQADALGLRSPMGVLTPWGSPSASGTSRTASPPSGR